MTPNNGRDPNNHGALVKWILWSSVIGWTVIIVLVYVAVAK